jgi:hypothetical protein
MKDSATEAGGLSEAAIVARAVLVSAAGVPDRGPVAAAPAGAARAL